MADTILITGGFGCIGSEAAKWLLRNTESRVVVASRRVSTERTERVFFDVDRSRMDFVELNVADGEDASRRVLEDYGVTRVVHMAALQTPDCNSNRDLGLQVNLAGTQHLIEAMKRGGLSLERFVFASSVAVYGPRADYGPGQVPMLAEPAPVNVYGVWKLAGEQLSKFFHHDTGVDTLCLRPGVLYGPGRDAGLTSTPTTAMKCVALGLPYTIPFRSRQDYLFAPDVGAAVGMSATESFEGYGVYTLPSWTLDMNAIVSAIQSAADELGIADRCQVSSGDDEVPFICDLEFAPFLERFPEAPHTALQAAVRQSLEVFLDQVKRGWLTEADIVR